MVTECLDRLLAAFVRRAGSARFVPPAGVVRVRKMATAAALLCLLTSVAARGDENASSLVAWEKRFHRDRALVKEPAVMAEVAIPTGFVALGKTDEAIRIGLEMAARTKNRTSDDVLADVAGALSRIDRLDDALAIAVRITNDASRQVAIGKVAQMQLSRGDLADARGLLPRLAAGAQDDLAEGIILRELNRKEFAAAAEHLALVRNEQRRARLRNLVEAKRNEPAPEDATYVAKKVEAVRERLRQHRQALKIESPASPDGDPTADAEVKLITCLAKARHWHARQEQSVCRRELETAWSVASAFQDEVVRIGNQISVASTAFQCDVRELTKKWLAELIRNPNVDGAGLSFSGDFLLPAAQLLSDDELRPAVKRWQQSDFPSDFVMFAQECAKLKRFDRLEWLHAQTDSAELRVAVDVMAMEWIVRHGK